MKVFASNHGGFGNVVFNQFAAILFTILFDAENISIDKKEEQEYYINNFNHVDDAFFLQIINAKINNNETIIDTSKNYVLVGYYQHDTIYTRYKKEIIEYLEKHPYTIFFTMHYPYSYRFFNIIEKKTTKIYDIVIHIRLGDFVELGWTMHPMDIKTLIEMLPIQENTSVAIIVNQSDKVVEHQYIRFIQELLPNATLEMHKNPMIDYNILRNAKRLVCSCSTLSWIAAMFAREDQIVYFPNYQSRWNHETFRKPHNRVLYYNFRRSYQVELWDILRDVRKIIKTDTPRVLFLNTSMHHKNLQALQSYKNIHLETVHSIEEFERTDLLFFDAVYSPAYVIEVDKYPNIKFIFGPHFSIFPEEPQINKIKYTNAIYVQPSLWVVNLWKSKSDNLRLEELPWGVDTVRFKEENPPEKRELVFVYYKSRNPVELGYIETRLKERNIEYTLFGYTSRYNEDDYVNCLKNAKYGIWVDAHESQGFALQEALSCNVPLLVWNITSMNQEYNSSYSDIPATTIPFWDERCGEVFYNESEFPYIFDFFLEKIEKRKYEPRKYILENISREVCENRLIKLIQDDNKYWKKI